jgi:hypothetical protein
MLFLLLLSLALLALRASEYMHIIREPHPRL